VKRELAAALALLVLAGCGIGRPWPTVTRTDSPAHLTVLLLGDSLLEQTAPYLRGALAFDGVDATVVNRSAGGTGLLDPDRQDDAVTEMDDVPERTIVVFEYSGNCFSSCPVLPGSPEFYEMWEAEMRDLSADAQDRGLVPVWANPPPFSGDPGHNEVVSRLATMATSLADELDIGMSDWSLALTDTNGKYQHDLWYADPWADPGWHQVRLDDGVHFTPDGARRAASWTAATIASVPPED
jgi:lysophospholipase L1-like esterase